MSIGTTVVTALTARCGAVAQRFRCSESFRDADDPATMHRLSGPLLSRYRTEGGPTGPLGRPVSGPRTAGSDPRTPVGADAETRFEYGAIYLHNASHSTKVVRRGGRPGAPTGPSTPRVDDLPLADTA